MSNNPFVISTEGLSPEVAAAVEQIRVAFAAKNTENAAYAGAQSLAEAVEKLRSIGA